MRNFFARGLSRSVEPAHRSGSRSPLPAASAPRHQRVPEPQLSADDQELRPATFKPEVVDLPIAPFEPRPPQSPHFRPDTVIDGWSTARFDVRLASVRGYSHRYSGQPRQDSGVLVHHDPTQSIVFAVADGVGNARQSEVGAQLACETAVDFVMSVLTNAGHVGVDDWRTLVHAVALRLGNRAGGTDRSGPGSERWSAGDFATTLVTGYVSPTPDGPVATLIQIGDSGAWLLHDEQFHDVLTPKTRPGAEVVSSTVSALPDVPEDIRPRCLSLPPASVLLIGTDGVGDPLGDGSGLVGDLFRTVLRELPTRLEFAHAVDFSRETFDDDRTLVAIWPHPPTVPRSSPPQ